MDQESLESAKEVYLEKKNSAEGEFSCRTLKFNPNSIGKVVHSLKKGGHEINTIIYPGAQKSFFLQQEVLNFNNRFNEPIEIFNSDKQSILNLLFENIFTDIEIISFLKKQLEKEFISKDKNLKAIKVLSALIGYLENWENLTGFPFKKRLLSFKYIRKYFRS